MTSSVSVPQLQCPSVDSLDYLQKIFNVLLRSQKVKYFSPLLGIYRYPTMEFVKGTDFSQMRSFRKSTLSGETRKWKHRMNEIMNKK